MSILVSLTGASNIYAMGHNTCSLGILVDTSLATSPQIYFEITSNGGLTWEAAYLTPIGNSTGAATNNISASGNYQLTGIVFDDFRIRIGSIVSGSVKFYINKANYFITPRSSIDVAIDGSGLATSAKQPSLGTAGTPSSDVISIQGETAMFPVAVQEYIDIEGNSQAQLTVLPSATQTSIALPMGRYDLISDVDCFIKLASTANNVTTSTGYPILANNMVSFVCRGSSRLGAISNNSLSGTIIYHKIG